MSSEAKISITVDGSKLAQDAFRDVEKAVEASKGKVDALSAGMKTAGEQATTGGKRLADMGDVGKRSFADMVTGIGRANGALSGAFNIATAAAGVFGATLGAQAIIGFGKAVLDSADALQKQSDKTGVSVEWLQKFQVAGDDAGNTVEELANGVSQMQKRFDDKDFRGAVGRLGIDFGMLRTMAPERQFVELSDAVRGLRDPLLQAQAATDLFGKAGVALLPTIKRGFDDVKETAVGMSEEAVRTLDAAGDAMARLSRKGIALAGEGLAAVTKSLWDFLDVQGQLERIQQGGPKFIDPVQQKAFEAFQATLDRTKSTAPEAAKGFEGLGRQITLVGDAAKKLAGPDGLAIKPSFVDDLKAAESAYRKLTGAQKADLAAAIDLGVGTDEITRMMGISEGVVNRAKKELALHKEELVKSESEARKAASAHKQFAADVAAGMEKIAKYTADNLNAAALTWKKYVEDTEKKQLDSFNTQMDARRAYDDAVAQDTMTADDFQRYQLDRLIQDQERKLKTFGESYRTTYQLIVDTTRIKLSEVGAIWNAPGMKDPTMPARKSVGDFGSTLQDLSRDIEQIATITDGSMGKVVQSVGLAIKAFEQLQRASQLMSAAGGSSGAFGGMNAASFANMAAGWIGIYTAMFQYAKSTYEAQAAQKALDRTMIISNQLALDYAATLQEMRGDSALTKPLANVQQFSSSLNAQLESLLNTLNKVFPNEPRGDMGAGGINILRAEALAAVNIIKELGGASELTASQIAKIKTDTIPNLLEMIAKGGPIATLAMESLGGLVKTFVPSFDDVTKAAAVFGFTIDDLGKKGKQIKLNEEARIAAEAFETLSKAGIDTGLIIDKMGKEAQKSFQDMVTAALKSGMTIPIGMKPILEAMAKAGKITDENGDKIEDLSKIQFTKPLEDMVKDLIAALDRLINKFGDVAEAAADMPGVGKGAPVESPGKSTRKPGTPKPSSPDAPDAPDFGGAQASGGDYMVTRPTWFLAGEAGAERAIFTPMGRSRGGAGGVETTIIIQAMDAASFERWLSQSGSGAAVTKEVARRLPGELRRVGAI